MRRHSLASPEDRTPLLHKCRSAFDIVGAGVASIDRRLTGGKISLVAILQRLADASLRRRDRKRSIADDGVGQGAHAAFELTRRHDTIDEPHLQRLGPGALSPAVEN